MTAARIGELNPINGTIYLAPYDPEWPSLFTSIKKEVSAVLGSKVVMHEHVGSTSIPGLSAKPVIDTVLVVPDSTDEASYVIPLEAKGYVLRIREPDWYEHRLLKSPYIDGNVHVFSSGCPEVDLMLLFRDWLRSHADDRSLYEQKKRELAAQTWKHTQFYADAKSEIVQGILTRAASKDS